jgi:chemotaxis protein histidine kinase CheA
MRVTYVIFLALLVFLAPWGRADDQAAPSPEMRMRQALRDTMLQLRDAQNQVVTLQATQAQSDKDKADLQAKVDALTAQLKAVTDNAAADKASTDKAIADLKAQSDDQQGQITRLTDGLKQWKDAYGQEAQLATTIEAARKQYALQAALLQRTVDDRETKNLALYKLGGEILTRYEQFGLGDALTAKEPFVGLSRVKLENLVQDYKNKLLDQAITTSPSTPLAQPAPTVKTVPAAAAKTPKPSNGPTTAGDQI